MLYQLANALPYDLEETNLSEYKNLDSRWRDWNNVKAICANLAGCIFDRVCDLQSHRGDEPSLHG